MIPTVLQIHWFPCRLLQRFIGVIQTEAAAQTSRPLLSEASRSTGEGTPSQDIKSPKQENQNTTNTDHETEIEY